MTDNSLSETATAKLPFSVRSASASVIIPLVSGFAGFISIRISPGCAFPVIILGFFAQILGFALSIFSVVAGFRYRAGGILAAGLTGFVLNGIGIYCVVSVVYFFTHWRC